MGKRKETKFVFSSNSKKNREGVNGLLIEISDRALELSPVDFGIPRDGGFRTFEQQRHLFDLRRSLCDGRFKISPHQVGCALDFYAYVNGGASWEPRFLAPIAAAFLQAASEKGARLEWGGFWKNTKKPDKDGIRWGWDCGHVQIWSENYGELYTVSQNEQANS